MLVVWIPPWVYNLHEISGILSLSRASLYPQSVAHSKALISTEGIHMKDHLLQRFSTFGVHKPLQKLHREYTHKHTEEREREAETQAEGEAGSMQGAWRGTRSWDSRIMPWAAGSTKPLRHRGCPAIFYLNLKWHFSYAIKYVINSISTVVLKVFIGLFCMCICIYTYKLIYISLIRKYIFLYYIIVWIMTIIFSMWLYYNLHNQTQFLESI